MTAALVLAAAWAGLALLAASRRRPAPRRLRLLASPHRFVCQNGDISPFWHTKPSRLSPPTAAGGRAVESVGALVLRLAPGRRPAPTPAAARTAGAVALTTAAALVVAPALAPAAAVSGWALARHRRRAAERRRLAALEAGLPELVDLVMLAVGAGCNVTLALAAAGRRASGPLGAELRAVTAEAARGRRLADALDDLPARAGEATRGLAGVLAGCERYGTPLLPALDRLASEVRLARQRRAEAAARRVPVALLFPLVLCILPAFALLTVAPLVAGALRELRL